MSSLALSFLQPTTISNLYCVFTTPLQITTNSPFLSTTIILLLNRLPASSSSSQTTDRLGRCFSRGFCAIKPTVNISNISQKTSQTSVSVFCTSLHITHRHTLKHVENIPDPSKHAHIIFQDFWLNIYCYVNNFILLDIAKVISKVAYSDSEFFFIKFLILERIHIDKYFVLMYLLLVRVDI